MFCSGDPDSLDGIYCPTLHRGYVDGTAPHRLDVRYMGAGGAYLDFSPFFDLAALREKRREICRLSDACSAEYQRAYAALGEFAAPAKSAPKAPSCFLRAVTCRGLMDFYPADTQRVTQKELDLLLQTACTVIAHPLFPALAEGVFLPHTKAYAFCKNDRAEQRLCDADEKVTPILARAKALHDELEALYHPFVDFALADALAKRHIQI